MPETATLARWLATWFGCGRSPIAPGTVGTLGALPLHYLLRGLSPLGYWTAVAALTAVGTWAAQREAERLGDDDPSSVVIDEVAGVLLALGLVRGGGLGAHALAVVLFRILDIAKPGPIDRVQHARPAGVGIMADDLLAGLVAGLGARWLAL